MIHDDIAARIAAKAARDETPTLPWLQPATVDPDWLTEARTYISDDGGMIISGKFFATGDGHGGISLVVQRVGLPGESVEGRVLNGGWEGTFTPTEATVYRTGRTFPAPVVWQGDDLIENGTWNAYGFKFVQEEIAAGRTGLTEARNHSAATREPFTHPLWDVSAA